MIELKSARTPTNGDKIRDASDEEIAEFIINDYLDNKSHFCKKKPECDEILGSGGTIADEMDKKEVKHLGSTFAYGEDVPVSQGTLIKKKPSRVVIAISGGICTNVYADCEISVEVLDLDNVRAAKHDSAEEYDYYKTLHDEVEKDLKSKTLKIAY